MNIVFLVGAAIAVAPSLFIQQINGVTVLGLVVMGISIFVMRAKRGVK